jgi:hypothetical protein
MTRVSRQATPWLICDAVSCQPLDRLKAPSGSRDLSRGWRFLVAEPPAVSGVERLSAPRNRRPWQNVGLRPRYRYFASK